MSEMFQGPNNDEYIISNQSEMCPKTRIIEQFFKMIYYQIMYIIFLIALNRKMSLTKTKISEFQNNFNKKHYLIY